MPDRNTRVQLLALYTNPESHNAQRHRQTDGQTDDDSMMPIADQYDRLIIALGRLINYITLQFTYLLHYKSVNRGSMVTS